MTLHADPPASESSPADDATLPARPSSRAAATQSEPKRMTATTSRRVRAALAVVAGRSAGALARRLRFGGGTSLPGLVARRVDPTVSTYLSAQLRRGSVVITGTNGKTTTSGLTATVLRAGGMRVWRNREGANLARGVTAALIIRALPSGRLRWQGNAAAVFEVDEAAFPRVVAEIQPRVIIVTNLFRDQLDRYGEVDIVTERWRRAIDTMPAQTTLVLNADDPAIAALATPERHAGAVYFGVESVASAADDPDGERTDVIDTRTCPRCRAPLVYSRRFYSHIGHWACARCDFARPEPAVKAANVTFDGLDATHFTLITPERESAVTVPLPGLYNVYNALAAVAAGLDLGVAISAAGDALARFVPAFGRAERISVDGRDVRLLLAKNPTGLNEVLRALAITGERPHLLLLLNDRAADGEDVSWIWDADLEQVQRAHPRHVTVGGTRAYDLALRLKYAGAPPQAIEPEIANALRVALEQTPVGETLYVAPTYTALLEVRGELERQGFAPRYWEQRDV
ncbi:MAG: MurT ligase domain-containing protein [Ktedonobacterales bacterium]